MKILSWNCRGGRGTPSIRHLRSHLSATTPEIMFVSETRCSEKLSQKKFSMLNFSGAHCVPSVGLSGGLWLLWNHPLSLNIQFSSGNFIVAEVHEQFMPNSWILVCVYGPPRRCDRKKAWDEISDLSKDFNLPWCCIGDFNAILSAAEKSGGSPVTEDILRDFKEFVHNTGLMDLGYSGSAFTWTNKRQAQYNIRERLDRALVDQSWRLQFQNAEVRHLPAVGSDHCPILLFTELVKKKSPAPFRFEAMLTHIPTFNDMITQHWRNSTQDSVTDKGLELIPKIKKWKRKHLGNWKDRINQLREYISHVQALPPSDHNLNKEKKAQEELESLLKLEESHWHQRSRSKWINDGDRNTKYFHLFTLNRKQKNKISRVLNSSGTLVEDEGKIKGAFSDYFSHLFSSVCSSPIITAVDFRNSTMSRSDNVDFCTLPSESDIKKVIFGMHPTKSPGPDGYPALFYQRFWTVIKEDLIKLIQNFFSTGIMPMGVNNTYIALIPKKKECLLPSDYRPISLSNVIYKTIAKILANRIKPHMQKIISPVQAAFLAGRSISDNIIIAREIIHHMKHQRGKKTFFALKLDMSKAFDRLDWKFLDGMLERVGMLETGRNLISQCITTTSFSILINGSPGLQFFAGRGIRQGCPLSPFLFILAMEALSKQLQLAYDQKLISGIKISSTAPPITHLLFADDAIIFGEATMREARMLRAILRTFSSMSGQEINFGKSSIFFSPNCDHAMRHQIKAYLEVGDLNPDDLYLGGCIFGGHPQRRVLKNMVAKTNTRLSGWKSHSLSHAGRTVLLKSTLAALPVYSMCTTEYPKYICENLDAIHRDFWWGFSGGKKHLYLRSWRTFQLPRKKGGLGIKNMQKTNEALSCKLAWRFCKEPENLWVQLLKAKYLTKEDFWGAYVTSSASPTWKALLKARSLLYDHSIWNIGNGKSVLVWRDKWVRNFSHLLQPLIMDDNTPYKVHDLINFETCSWNMERIHRYFDPIAASAILNTPLGNLEDEDTLIWTGTSCGRFTTKSAYMLLSEEGEGEPSNITTAIAHTKALLGKKCLAPRVHIFLWRCFQNALPTKSELHKRGILTDDCCTLCNSQPESLEHLLIKCPHARQIWQSTGFNISEDNVSFAEWITSLLNNENGEHRFALAASTSWHIWKSRCDATFMGKIGCPKTIAIQATIFYNTYWQEPSHPSHSFVPSSWQPPDDNCIKINVDGAATLDAAAAALVARNHKGMHVISKAIYLSPMEPIRAETIAFLTAIEISSASNWHKVVVEGDSLIVAKLLQNHELVPPWTIYNEIRIAAAGFWGTARFPIFFKFNCDSIS